MCAFQIFVRVSRPCLTQTLSLCPSQRWLFFPPTRAPPGVRPAAEGGGEYVTPTCLAVRHQRTPPTTHYHHDPPPHTPLPLLYIHAPFSARARATWEAVGKGAVVWVGGRESEVEERWRGR